MGAYGFALEETGDYVQAKAKCEEALAINPQDTWTTHSMAHVLHETCKIDNGLEFNSRGSKTKSLRRKKSGTWQSTGSAVTMSASTIGYHETWSISGLSDVPTFTRDDVLGSERAESMSGRTPLGPERRGIFKSTAGSTNTNCSDSR